MTGCDRPSYARRLCVRHYKRAWRNGSPTGGRVNHGSAVAFLREASGSGSDECIVWPFAVRNGYGAVRFNGVMTNAARAALEIASGLPPSPAHQAAHAPTICHNRLCVNARHLRWASPSDNMSDQVPDGTRQRGERHKLAKLTTAQVLAIRADQRQQRVIAEAYSVSRGTISDIKCGRNWGWL